jgi:hypothetical protein
MLLCLGSNIQPEEMPHYFLCTGVRLSAPTTTRPIITVPDDDDDDDMSVQQLMQ